MVNMSHETNSNTTTPPPNLIRLPRVQAKTGDPSRATVWRRVKARTFPQPVKVGGCSLWSETEVDQWIADRLAERGR